MHETSIGGIDTAPKSSFLSSPISSLRGTVVTFFFLWHSEFAKWAALSLQGCQSFILVIFLAGERIEPREPPAGILNAGKKIGDTGNLFHNTQILTKQEGKENKKTSYWIKIIKNYSIVKFRSHISTAKGFYDMAHVRSMTLLHWQTLFLLLSCYLGSITSSNNKAVKQSYHGTPIVHTL